MHDIAAVVSSEMNIQNPYLLTDVEVYHREYVRTTRDDLSEACREAWSQEACGGPAEVEPLPMVENGMTSQEIRLILRQHQMKDKKTAAIIAQLEEGLDGGAQRRRQAKEAKKGLPGGAAMLQQSYSRDRLSKLQMNEFRLNPLDAVLEARVSFVDRVL